MVPLPPHVTGEILSRLTLAVVVFRETRLVYSNPAADSLRRRLHASYRIELDVLLRDHLRSVFDASDGPVPRDRLPLVSLLTATNGEPFYLHVIPLSSDKEIAVTIRMIGSEIDAVRRRYGLSARESQVAELVLHGYRNADIAAALEIAPATAKKHLSKVFDKIGVQTRSQLQTRLA